MSLSELPSAQENRATALTDEQLTALRERARREAGTFVDPRILHKSGPHYHSREWAEAIVDSSTFDLWRDWPTMYLLHIAMEAEPNPPVTRAQATAAAEREATIRTMQEARARAERLAAERKAADLAKHSAALRTCLVKITVHENTKGRMRGGNRERLRHIVPGVEAASGRSRRHLAGRALCETPGRVKPLALCGEPTDQPATCVRCLMYLPQIRTAGGTPTPQAKSAPRRPTQAQRDLLKLIDDGKVSTIRVRYGVTFIAVTSQRSKGAWGHFGRKVTTQVRAMKEHGWVTETEGTYGNKPWELTAAGHEALER